MKVQITFNVDQAEEAQFMAMVMNSGEFYNAVWELNANMRNHFKHKDWDKKQWEAHDEIRAWLFEEVFDRCIRIVNSCEP